MTLSKLSRTFDIVRYRILKNNALLSFLYRCATSVLYPLFRLSSVLSIRFLNRKNIADKNILLLVDEFLKEKPNVTKKDLVLSWLWYHIIPEEYEMYDFENKKHSDRLAYLSDADRWMLCDLVMGMDTYYTLRDKWVFYQMMKEYYKRKVFKFDSETTKESLDEFVRSISSVFCKPLTGTFGAGAFRVDTGNDKASLFERLQALGDSWILEETIVQSPEMSVWNESSVNTVRIPSFRHGEECDILLPFMRTGRNGAVVDNAGSGGVFAVINERSGVVETDGVDEKTNVYIVHPDSGIRYKGFQLPDWNQLLSISKSIHLSLPKEFVYVGFDFAHTENGWLLIEGNWGQMVGQIATQKGIRSQFEQEIGI